MSKKLGNVCFLSGLEIPPGKYSKEHYVPVSRAPHFITSDPNNIFPAHKVVNHIKQNFLPCEWQEKKWNLTYHAIHNWHLKQEDVYYLTRTLYNWEHYTINPCDYCLLHCTNTTRTR